jgi:hypothetical protein
VIRSTRARSPHAARSTTVAQRPRLAVAAVVAVAVLTGCTSTPDAGAPAPAAAGTTAATEAAPGTQTGIADPDDIDPGRLAPLAGLASCTAPAPAAEALDTGPLPLPDASIVATASTDGPLLTAQGYSERTPVEIMVGYLRLEGWTVLNAEDEVFESEMLIERDGLRVFAKAQAVCERGSAFVMFASTDPGLVPAPAGG